MVNERINSHVTESRKCSSINIENDHTPKKTFKNDSVSEIGEHDLQMTLKRIENYIESSPSELINPLEDFKKSFWRNEPDSPSLASPLKIKPNPIFSPHKT